MVLKKVVKLIILLQFIFFSSCDNFVLIQPYFLDGSITVFYDGEMIGTYYEPRIDGTNVAIESDLNFSYGYGDETNPDMVDDLLVYHRMLDSDEISSLYETNGDLPDDKSDLVGYYQFEGNLENSSLGSSDDGIESGATASYVSGGISGTGLNITTGDEGNINFNSTILPNVIEEMTINIWVKSSIMKDGEFISILNCWGGDDHDDFFNIDYDGGAISSIIHSLSDYDADEWHMITYVIE
ncbi:MAG: hypothetical protein OCD02_18620 [Spirochaetaceae bacterium]